MGDHLVRNLADRGIFGFSGVSAATSRIAKILFFISVAIFVILVLLTIVAAKAIF